MHVREPRLPLDYAWAEIDVAPRLLESGPGAGFEIEDEEACETFGSEWVRSSTNPAIQVPSVIIPTERNLLVNPYQVSFGEIVFSSPRPFRFDPRLLKIGPTLAP